jgi:hypothetical protein
VVYLSQNDFTEGSYLVNLPHTTIILTEDIVFNPNSMSTLGKDAYESGDVQPAQFKRNGGQYDEYPFVLGFFCGICVYSYNITINFNGFTFSQSEEHALHQRFFAVIELSSAPFIPKQGPANFGPTFCLDLM